MRKKELCPYCNHKSLVTDGHRATCTNDRCNKFRKKVNLGEIEAIRQSDFEEYHRNYKNLMESY